MKLTDEELRRWRFLMLTPAQHDGIINELLAARRVIEALERDAEYGDAFYFQTSSAALAAYEKATR